MKSVIIATLFGVVVLHLVPVEGWYPLSKIAKTHRMIASFTHCMRTVGTFPPLDITTPEGRLLDKLRVDLYRLSRCTVWNAVVCAPVHYYKVASNLFMMLMQRPVLITEVVATPFKCALRLMCFFKIGLVPVVKCDDSANFLGISNAFVVPPGPVPPSPFGPVPPPMFEVPFPNQPAPPFGNAMDSNPNTVPNHFNPQGPQAPGTPPFMPNFVQSNISQWDAEFQQSNFMGSPDGPSFNSRPPQGPFAGQGNGNSPNMFGTSPSFPGNSQNTGTFDTPGFHNNSKMDDFFSRPPWGGSPQNDSPNSDQSPKSTTAKSGVSVPEFDKDLYNEIGNNATKQQTANDLLEFGEF